ncbi:hypothetical protein ABIB90_007151 [Bradyrhizobium sp. JR4.1]
MQAPDPEVINLDRSAPADGIGPAAWRLRPLHPRLLAKLSERPKLSADETTVPMLDPVRGRTKIGQLCAYVADGRPWRRSARGHLCPDSKA